MIERDNRLLDDLARVAGGALSSFSALREEAEARVREQLERILERMELVNRDEFEAVRQMAVKAREENAALAERVAALEAQIGAPLKAEARAAKPRTSKARAGTRGTGAKATGRAKKGDR